MQKLKALVEMIGRKRNLFESMPEVNGIMLKPGMKVVLQTANIMFKNHYYEQHPQFYKKMIPQIADTVQKIEEIKPNAPIESDNIKLVGWDYWIEVNDILKVKGK